MAEPILPRAQRRYPHRNKHTPLDTRDARYALALTGCAGLVIVCRRGRTGTKRAAKVAKAWNEMVSQAEARHESYWARHDRG